MKEAEKIAAETEKVVTEADNVVKLHKYKKGIILRIDNISVEKYNKDRLYD